MNTIIKELALVLVGASMALLALSSQADIVTTGVVTPSGLGPGDTTAAPITVGGDFETPDVGTLTVDEGSLLTTAPPSAPFANLGPLAGSDGRVTVTGAGSRWSLEGTDGADGAFLTVGRGGIGVLDINDGAEVEINALGAVLARGVPGVGFPAGFNIGRDPGSDGTVNLSGSEFIVNSDFAFGRIGRKGTGEFNIVDGAVLSFSGINSDLNVSSDVFMPPGGRGVLNVNTGGRIVGPVFLDVGGSQGGEGIVNLDGAASSINLTDACTPDCPTGFSFPNQGAFLTVGANEGTGVVNITGGAKFMIDSSATPGARFSGFATGGSSILGPIGDGTINVDGPGSELVVKGDQGFFSVGRLEDGTGALNILNGGKVIMENADGQASGFVGDRPGAVGSISVGGDNSLLDAGSFLGVGVDQQTMDAGGGTVTLSEGGTVLSDELLVGFGGTVQGIGTLAARTPGAAQVIVDRGVISVGSSPGQIDIDGDLEFIDGMLEIEVGGLDLADHDVLNVSGNANFTGGTIRMSFIDGFLPRTHDTIAFLVADSVDRFKDVTLEFKGVASDFEFEVNPGVDGLLEFTAVKDARPPGTVAIALDIKRARVSRRHHRTYRHRRNRDRFSIRARFELGGTSDGIDLLTEAVTVTFGGFTEALRAGSFFRDHANEGFKFINHDRTGGIKQIKIRDDGLLRIEGRRLDLSELDLTEPVVFSLQIGDDDFGTTDIPFNRRGRFPRRRH